MVFFVFWWFLRLDVGAILFNFVKASERRPRLPRLIVLKRAETESAFSLNSTFSFELGKRNPRIIHGNADMFHVYL